MNLPLPATAVSVRRIAGGVQTLRGARPGLERHLASARLFADWMDTRFSLFGIRFGLESILGLLPVGGDLAGALLGLYPVLIANRYRLGYGLQLRMVLNLVIEALIGVVPLLGDVFDTIYKANVRNVALLEEAARNVRARDAVPVRL